MDSDTILDWITRHRTRLSKEGWSVLLSSQLEWHPTSWVIELDSDSHVLQVIVWETGAAEYYLVGKADWTVQGPFLRRVEDGAGLQKVIREGLRATARLGR